VRKALNSSELLLLENLKKGLLPAKIVPLVQIEDAIYACPGMPEGFKPKMAGN
jgi:hypothetical protein